MKKTKKAIIFGSGNFAQLVHYHLTHDSVYEVAAFTVSKTSLNQSTLHSLPIIPFEEVEEHYPPDEYDMYIAIGYRNLNALREKYYHKAKEKNYTLLTYISSDAKVCTNEIGDNCFVFEGNNVQPFAKIDNNVVLWSGNHIGHHVHILSHNWFCSHIIVGGGSIIKENCFIGGNTSIGDGVTIEYKNLIGTHCVITQNTEKEDAVIAEKPKTYKNKASQVLNLMLESNPSGG